MTIPIMRPRVNSPRRAAGRAACGGWRGGDGGGGAGGCRGVTGGGGGGAAGGCRGVTGGGGGAAGGGTAAPTEGALRGARHLAQNLALGRLGVPHFGQVIVAIVLSFLMIFQRMVLRVPSLMVVLPLCTGTFNCVPRLLISST